jgi:hypothetical protein
MTEKSVEEQIIDELKKDHPIEEMIKFSEINLMEKLQENSFMIVKYREHYYLELFKLEELEDKYDKLVGLRYQHYRFEDDKEWTKVEIEKYCIPSDSKILQFKRIMARQKARVRFFEIAYKAFEQVGWRMKTYSDNLRYGG